MRVYCAKGDDSDVSLVHYLHSGYWACLGCPDGIDTHFDDASGLHFHAKKHREQNLRVPQRVLDRLLELLMDKLYPPPKPAGSSEKKSDPPFQQPEPEKPTPTKARPPNLPNLGVTELCVPGAGKDRGYAVHEECGGLILQDKASGRSQAGGSAYCVTCQRRVGKKGRKYLSAQFDPVVGKKSDGPTLSLAFAYAPLFSKDAPPRPKNLKLGAAARKKLEELVSSMEELDPIPSQNLTPFQRFRDALPSFAHKTFANGLRAMLGDREALRLLKCGCNLCQLEVARERMNVEGFKALFGKSEVTF